MLTWRRDSMHVPKWMRFLLIAAGCVAGFYVLLYVGIAVVWNVAGAVHHAEHDQLVREAQAFGRARSADACVSEALARAGRCKDGMCVQKANDFLGWSLTAAPDSKLLCATVPASAADRDHWLVEECARRGRANDPYCTYAMRAVFGLCPASLG